MVLIFPVIPLLAFFGIVGGITALAWYSKLSREEKERADRAALKWFGRRFRELSEAQQKEVRNRMRPPD